MEYETRSYFTEHDADDVKGFTIIDTSEERDEYHIAEKWSRAENEDKWLQYWIPEAQLLSRVQSGDCEYTAELTQEQYEKVCQMIDHDGVVAAPA